MKPGLETDSMHQTQWSGINPVRSNHSMDDSMLLQSPLTGKQILYDFRHRLYTDIRNPNIYSTRQHPLFLWKAMQQWKQFSIQLQSFGNILWPS